jgi:membrane fusion protein, multidrug efflux system
MKIRQFVIFGIFLLVSALIYFRLSSSKKNEAPTKKEKKEITYLPISIVKNSLKEFKMSSYGQINPTVDLDVSFEVQGKLEYGEKVLKPGVKFKKGQLLYQVNNEEAYYSLVARKSQFSSMILSLMPDVELDFPSEKNKWLNFLSKINNTEIVPQIPSFSSSKEKMFFTGKGILAEYFNIKGIETRMNKHFYLAPFNGTVSEVYAEPGSLAGPGVRIAKIVKTGDYEVKVPISIKNLSFFKKETFANFYDSQNQLIGKGRILRISDIVNQKTQSTDVYYSIQVSNENQIYNGMFLTVSISKMSEQENVTLPRLAIENNSVQVLKNGKVFEKNIVVLGNKPDSLYVANLSDGEQVVLERIKIIKNQVVKGIIR